MKPIVILTSTGCSSLARPLIEAGATQVMIREPECPTTDPRCVFVTRCTGMGKLEQLRKLSAAGVPTVPWTTSVNVADAWAQDGYVVFVRKMLNASRGKGIIIHTGRDGVPDAPLYTRQVPCKREWRVHYAFGKTAAVKKLLPEGATESLIRNRKNGYVFSGLRHNAAIEATGRWAIEALGYDFGAVDIIESTDGGLCVLEVNRAPGIKSPSAKQFYITAIIEEASR